MADNTTINAGVGGDVLRTEDIGGVKIPVSKIHNGASDVDGGPITAANPFQVVIASGSQGVSVVGTSLSTMPQSGSLFSLLVGGNIHSAANPAPVTGTVALARGVTASSGSLFGLLVGGVAASQANPLPVSDQSGSVVGLLVGGVPLSHANPLPIGSAWDQSGQVISGSTVRTVQYSFGDFTSGSANQVVPPQGASNMIRVLSAHVMAPGASTIRWISTGSAGTITNISGLSPVPANGGYVLPFNQHGWFQTKANEGLNAQFNGAGTVGITLTWIVTGP